MLLRPVLLIEFILFKLSELERYWVIVALYDSENFLCCSLSYRRLLSGKTTDIFVYVSLSQMLVDDILRSVTLQPKR